VLGLTAFFGFRLRKCEISAGAVKTALPCLFAAMIGPVFAKMAMAQADVSQAPYSYVLFEAIAMTTMWGIYAHFKKPMTRAEFFSPRMIKAGLGIGAITAFMVVCGLLSIHYAANPAYTPAIRLLSAVFIVIIYRVIKHQDRGDVLAGFGIVASALALVLLDAVGE